MNDNLYHDASSEIAAHSSAKPVPPPSGLASVQLKGVGGWLLFYVIGQLALRPLLVFAKLIRTTTLVEIAEKFPFTGTIIKVELAVQIGLALSGIVVGCALLRTGVSWPVLVTKVYLIANALLILALTVLNFSSDLPEDARLSLITRGLINGLLVATVSFLWFLYFTRSKRVQATYFGNSEQPGRSPD